MIRYETKPEGVADAVAALLGSTPAAVAVILARSLTYICSFDDDRLVGYVTVAWDGGVHAFLLDPTVDASYRRRGIGSTLVHAATDEARRAGCEWLHVDFEAELQPFYDHAGFVPTNAGLIHFSTRTTAAP